MLKLAPGRSATFGCGHCTAEFRLTYEPKEANRSAVPGGRPVHVSACPFCGDAALTSEDADSDEDSADTHGGL